MSLYEPPHFVVSDRALLLELMRMRPLATLVSTQDGELQFTHLPLEIEEKADGLRLLGHVARPNPHWKSWVDGTPVTAIFRGPDGYVSPSWYAVREAVPTWNYVIVHAHGRVLVTHDSEAKEHILKALIDRHDPAYRQQWDELAEEFREKMKRGIVGLSIAVDRLQGKFKLSQNRPAEDRQRVLVEMRAGGDSERGVAEWMQRLGIAG